jgi:Holliday junction resolvase
MTMKTRSFILGILAVLTGWLFSTAPLKAQVGSNDPNFTPALLKSGLSMPSGVVFRPPTGDLLVSQQNEVSIVNATSGATSTFVSIPGTFPDKIDVRSSDGLVSVIIGPFGPINFYNSSGSFQGSINESVIGNANLGLVGPETTVCLSGAVFDASGNLFVAAGPAALSEGAPTGCLSTNWGIYEFAGSPGTPWTATPTRVTPFSFPAMIQDMAYSAAKPPAGTLYEIDSQKNVYEMPLTPPCTDCGISLSFVASVSAAVNPRGIAIDSLLGDLYITDFGGTNVFRVPAPGLTGDPSPTVFATGFSNTLRLAFDGTGNLYINETNGGNLWEFARNSGATSLVHLTSGKINAFTFTNPIHGMSDQKQALMIPASATLGGAAFLRDVFVPVEPNTLNTTLQNGTTGDTSFFGGAPVPAGTTCIQVPSAASSPTHPNCVVVIQQCFDANQNPFAICPVQEPSNSTDLIQLTFSYAGSQPTNPAFLIGFDNGDGQDLTDITIGSNTDPTVGGGTKGLCSKDFGATLPAGSGDFSLIVSPSTLDLTATNSASATATLTSVNSFASPVALGVSDVPAGLLATLTPPSVTPSANGTASSVLNVGFSTNSTVADISTIIENLLANGCIDNPGIANALTSKLSAAQMAISGGQIQTAINILRAFKHQVRAQTGKHIASSCTTIFPLLVTGTPFVGTMRLTSANVELAPASLLNTEVQGIINSLKASVPHDDDDRESPGERH